MFMNIKGKIYSIDLKNNIVKNEKGNQLKSKERINQIIEWAKIAKQNREEISNKYKNIKN